MNPTKKWIAALREADEKFKQAIFAARLIWESDRRAADLAYAREMKEQDK